MTYDLLRNARCLYDSIRYKWACLGRTSASQSSHAIDELGRAFGWGQNDNGEAGVGNLQFIAANTYGRPNLYAIELATQLNIPGKCIKICSGEVASAALNDRGELYGWGEAMDNTSLTDNCASFALPHDSGESRKEWMGVIVPDERYYFFTPTRMAPGYLFKDFSFDFYHATAIGLDNKLYTWGYDSGDGALGLGPGVDCISIPTLNPTLTADIKFLDSELFCSSAVTVDDRVYVWGDWWAPWGTYLVPTEITGLVIPPGETIVGLSNDYLNGVLAVLSNGELWAAGRDFLYGDQGVTGDSLTFKQVTCFTNPIVLAKITSLGASALAAIDDQGNIYGWSDGDDEFVGNSPTPSPDWELPNLIASEYPGNRKFIDVILNTHNDCYSAIDDLGYLWTWGGQWWGPHLATNTAAYQADIDLDPDVEGLVYLQPIASYAKDAVLFNGDPALLNVFPLEESEYIQPLPQMLRHKPCGHWHLRLFEGEEIWPCNCWMPSVAIYENHLMFVACGKYLQTETDTGCEVIIFDYDMDANTWTLAMYDESINAAEAPGGASIYDDTMVFANWKADVSGSRFDAVYSNYRLGVWVLDGAYSMNYTEFVSKVGMYMQGKAAAYSGGVAAVAYEDAGGQLLVQVSTDYGATWNLRRTVGVDAARKDYSLCIDENGYIYLAHQVSHASVKVERSIDNGANWTVQAWANVMITNMLNLKIVADNDMLFLFASSATASAIERSSNSGVTWSTILGEPFASAHVSSGCNVDDDNIDIAFVTSGIDLNNYLYDLGGYGAYTWLTRTIPQISEEGFEINTYQGPNLADLNGYNGRFAYAAYTFYTVSSYYVAVAISVDRGATWTVKSTPLGWASNVNELGDFRGQPLFFLTDVPYLDSIWKFEKSSWDTDFVKQGDKYSV